MHLFFTPWPLRHKQIALFCALAMTVSVAAEAIAIGKPDVSLRDAWVRTPRDGYRTTMAFMTLQSADALRLVGASSPAAQAVQLQKTARHGATIQAERIEHIELPPGQPVAVQIGPEQYQLLVVGLRQGLKEGDRIPLRLVFGDSSGKHMFDRTVSAIIRSPAGYTPHEREDMH